MIMIIMPITRRNPNLNKIENKFKIRKRTKHFKLLFKLKKLRLVKSYPNEDIFVYIVTRSAWISFVVLIVTISTIECLKSMRKI